MGRERLRMRARAVAEQASLVRAHLEETKVLAVLRRRLEVRFAPRDRDRIPAVTLEHFADGCLRWESREPVGVACMNLHAQHRDGLR